MKQRDILKFWLPLLGSWIFVTMEGPVITTAINRLPDPIVMLAAAGIVISLSVFIESPIINILSTSTAKVEDWTSYAMVRRFIWQWNIGLTLIHIIVSFTPVFDLVVMRGMGISAEIANWVRVGMQLMVPWTAAIGWRRFLQGVLIKFGRTQTIAIGTLIRLIATAATVFGLAILTDFPAVIVGALTWVTGVSSEAIYASVVIRPLLRNELSPDKPQTSTLTSRELFWFHLPLAGSAALALLVQPLVVFSLARQPDSELTLAAWPIMFAILLMARSPALALPEVIIALNKDAEHGASLRRFVGYITVASVCSMLLFFFTPISDFYLNTVQQVPEVVGGLVRRGVAFSLLFPALVVVNMAVRGFLISARSTRAINQGMMLNLFVTGLVLAIGVMLGWEGILTGALALTIAVVIELIFLFRLVSRDMRTGALVAD